MLSEKRIAKLNAPGRYKAGEVRGLCLQVTVAGSKSWLLRYQISGRERWLGLGPIGLIGLKQARERARAARVKLLDGIDPLEEKRTRRSAAVLATMSTATFQEAAESYLSSHRKKWRSAATAYQFTQSMEAHVFPQIGALSVAAVDTGQVLKVIEPLWGTKTETANRVRKRIEAILDFASVRGLRPAGDNPARWKGHLEHILPARQKVAKTVSFPSMPYVELPAFMVELRKREGLTPRALEFCILTAARSGEVLGAKWSEIDLENRIWTVPAERMKGHREHRVPLSEAAIAILKVVPREVGNDHVFIGQRRKGRGMSDRMIAHTLKRMNRTDVSVHGFRSTFRTWAGEQTAYPSDLLELSLAHRVGSATEQVYRRTDLANKRRRLMADWAAYCASSVAAKRDNVKALRGGKI